MSEVTYTDSEMMVAVAARVLKGARTVFVGVGLPNIACNLARYTVAPDLELIYESGVYGARPERLPLSIGDPTLVSGAVSVVSMADLFGLYLQRGLVEVALLGGAQIDRFGNLNTTVIGDYKKPQNASTRQRRCLRNCHQRSAHVYDHASKTPGVCRQAGFSHESRTPDRRRQPHSVGIAGRRAGAGDHRQGDLELRQPAARDAAE